MKLHLILSGTLGLASLSGCTAEQVSRTTYNALNQRECQRTADPVDCSTGSKPYRNYTQERQQVLEPKPK